jgi:hypothetical protein
MLIYNESLYTRNIIILHTPVLRRHILAKLGHNYSNTGNNISGNHLPSARHVTGFHNIHALLHGLFGQSFLYS